MPEPSPGRACTPGRLVYLRRGVVAICLASVTVAALAPSGLRAPPSEKPPCRSAAEETAPPRPPAPARSLARLVPADAAAFVSFPNLPGFLRRARRTGVARMLEDAEGGPFFKRAGAEFVERNVDLVSVLQTLRLSLIGREEVEGQGAAAGEVAIAVLGADGGTGRPEVVLLAETARAQALAGTLEAYALLHGGARRHSSKGVVVASIGSAPQDVRPEGKRGVLCAWGIERDLFVAGTCVSAVRGALLRAQPAAGERASGSLERDRDFAESVTRLSAGRSGAGPGGADDYLVYVDLDRALPASAAEALAGWGLEGIDHVALVGRIGEGEDAALREAVYLHAPGKRGPLLGFLSGSGQGGADVSVEATARLVPSRASIALFAPVEGPAAAESVRSRIAPFVREGRLPGVPRGFAGLLELLARCMEPLGATGGEACVFLWSVGRVNWMPRLGCVAAPAEFRTFRTAWSGLARDLGGRLLEHRVEVPRGAAGETGRVVIQSIERAALRLPFVRSPASCVTDGRLFAASDAAAVRELLLTEQGGLAETEGMRRLLAGLPERRRLFFYADVPRIVDRAFEPYAPAAMEVLLPGVFGRLGREAMPPGSAIARHMRPAALSLVPDARGLRIDAVTPAGLIPAAALLGVVVSAW